MTAAKQNLEKESSESAQQVAAAISLLCQLLVENPAIQQTILNNYNSELFWLKQSITTKISTNKTYINSPEYQADLTNLHIRTMAYQQVCNNQELQDKIKAQPELNQDTKEQEHRQIVALIEENKEKLYQELAANPEASQQILSDYDKKVNQLEQNIATKKKARGAGYTNSQEYDTDSIELQTSDQAYNQVYASVTGKNPAWMEKLEQEVYKKQKIGGWIQLALSAAQATSSHLVQGLGITSTLSNITKPQNWQKSSELAKSAIVAELSRSDISKTSDTPTKGIVERTLKAVAEFKPGLPIESVFAATLSQVKAMQAESTITGDLFKTSPSIAGPNKILEAALGAYQIHFNKILETALDAYLANSSSDMAEQLLAKVKSALENGADASEVYLEKHSNKASSKISEDEDSYNLPSNDLAKLLLSAKKPLDPSKFLSFVMSTPCTDPEGGPDKELLARQYSLVKLALEHGADANKIYSEYQEKLDNLPSNDLAELLLSAKKPLNPDKLLSLVINRYVSEELLAQKNDLIELAAAKGATFDEFPYIKNYYQPGRIGQLPQLNQWHLQNNLEDIIRKYFPEDEAMLTLAKHLRAGKGKCISFTTLWLYSKYQQSMQPDKRGGYNQDYDKDWYGNTIRKIDLYNESQALSSADIADIRKFAQTLDFLESPRYYQEGFRPADTRIHEVDSRLTTDGKVLHEQYQVAVKFNSYDHLKTFLEKILHEGVSMYVVDYHGDIRMPGHFTGVVKHDNKYYYYDPSNEIGEIQLDSIEAVAGEIGAYSTVGFIVGSFEQTYTDYPSPESILTANYPLNYKFTKEELGKGAMTAILVRSKESLKFYLDHGLSPKYKNKYGVSLLQAAVLANDQDSVKMLIELGANPNDCASGKTTCLHLSAIKGFPKVAKALLTDPRTKIERKDGNKTTAFEIARNKSYTKTAEQIKTEIEERLALKKSRGARSFLK